MSSAGWRLAGKSRASAGRLARWRRSDQEDGPACGLPFLVIFSRVPPPDLSLSLLFPACALAAALGPSLLSAGEIADVIDQARITGGIVVVIGGSDRSYDDAAGSRCTVQGLERNVDRVRALRTRLQADGRYGRVSVSPLDGETLPYIDNLVNLVTIEDGSVTEAEALRVLAPRGIALIRQEGAWAKRVKPVPDDVDEWNQYLHGADNNGVSADCVGPPERLRWTGGTRWGRSHMSWVTVTSMLSAGGRLFTIEDLESIEFHKLAARFHLVARDAFNGCELWRRPLKNWYSTNSYVKFVPTQIQRRAAAIGDKVYCTLGYDEPIRVLDAPTGKVLQTLAGTANTREFAIDGGVVYAIVGQPYGDRNEPAARVVTLKALAADDGVAVWAKTIGRQGGYIGGTLAVKDTCLAYATRTHVICCDAATGEQLWAVESAAYPGKSGATRRVPGLGSATNTNPTLVLTDDMVYCSTLNTVRALRRDDGQLAWTAKNVPNYMKGSDIFIADGLVWTGLMVGHDPETGEVKRRLTQEMHQPMGHDRCYRNRITESYFINSKTGGSDFVALDGRGEFPSPWVRATCGLGPLPCNGMLYSSPFSCSCLKGTMLTGFKALYSDDRAAGKVMRINPRAGLLKGPAYGTAPTMSATAADWPVYRNDNARSGRTSTPVDGKLVGQWETKLPFAPDGTDDRRRPGLRRRSRQSCFVRLVAPDG